MPTGILLDADVPPAVAVALSRRGHDAVAASGDPTLERLADDELLREASRRQRVLATFNVGDFVEVVRRFAQTQDDHRGVILIHARSFPRTDIGAITDALDRLLRSKEAFENAVLFLHRGA